MKEKKLILHVGMPKAGSSSLQNYLFQNKNLLARNSLLYPQAGLFYDKSHNNLGFSILGTDIWEKPQDIKVLLDEITREIETQNSDVLILSSELLWTMTDNANSKFFFNWVNNYFSDAYLLAIFRTHTEFFQSLFFQFIQDHNLRYAGTFEDFINVPNISENGYYAKILGGIENKIRPVLRKSFAYSFTKPLNYKKIILEVLTVVKQNCEGLDDLVKTGQKNLSIQRPFIDLLWCFNKQNIPQQKYIEILKEIQYNELGREKTFQYSVMTKSTKKFIENKYKSEVEQINERFGNIIEYNLDNEHFRQIGHIEDKTLLTAYNL